MSMVQMWKMLLGQQPVRKRYLQKQTSILNRVAGRGAMVAVAARVAEVVPRLSHAEGRVACGAP